MATVTGTLVGFTLAQGSWEGTGQSGQAVVRKTYLCTFSAGAYTGSTDSVRVTGLDTSIQNDMKNGHTFTIRGAMGAGPGLDTSGNPVFANPSVTAGTTAGQIDFTISNNITAASSNCAASTGFSIYVMGDETIP